MKLIAALSTHLFAFRPLDTGIIAVAAAAGFRAVEIFAAPQHFDVRDARAAARMAHAIGRAAERAGVRILAIHAPFYESLEGLRAGRLFALGDPAPDSRARAIDAVLNLMPVAADMGSPHIVVHAGHPRPERPDRAVLVAAMSRLTAGAGTFAGRLLLENTPRTGLGAVELADLAADLDGGRTGLCIDLGHCHLEAPRLWDRRSEPAGADAADAASRALAKTHHFHVHDNHGGEDEHLPPGLGGIDWENLTARLGAAAGPDGCAAGFALELRDPSRGGRPADEILRESLENVRGPIRALLRREGVRP